MTCWYSFNTCYLSSCWTDVTVVATFSDDVVACIVFICLLSLNGTLFICSLHRTCLPWRLSLQRSSADRPPSILVWNQANASQICVFDCIHRTTSFDFAFPLLGTIGHVAHGKSTVVKAISGVHTVRFKNELERNITIKLGYANAKVSG